MSGTLTTAYRRRMLDHHFRETAKGFAQFKAHLTRKVPSANAAVSQLDVPVGMAYAPVVIPFGAAHWAMTLSGEAATNDVLYYANATGTWGVMTGWALVTDEASPMVAAVGQLVVPYRVIAGIRPYLPLAALAIGLYD